jgi:transcriptional regulator GlxA family with amidase domain
VEDAAKALGVSMRSLQRRLKAIGTSFREQASEARLETVIDRLVRTDAKLETIAREVGCSSTAHLSLVFRKSTGETPRKFRRRFLERSPQRS